MTAIAAAAYPAAFAAAASGGIAIDAAGTDSTVHTYSASPVIAKTQSLSVIGWAFPPSANGGCSAIGLAVDKKHVYPGTYGYGRPDVASQYKNDELTNVGYSIAVPATALGAGTHTAYVVCYDSPQSASRSFNPLTIRVR